MAERLKHVLCVVSVSAIVLFTNLGKPRLWDRDEPRNAGAAVEMLARGDWCVPVFNNELRTHKPILLYWLIMSAYSVWGVNEFAARFWSAALAVGTTLATYCLGQRLFGSRVGLWSALILATCLMFDLAARAATPDSALVFCSTLALLIYVRGAFPQQSPASSPMSPVAHAKGPMTGRVADLGTVLPSYFPTSVRSVFLMYAVMGIGILAKGPVALVLPTAVIGMFLLVTTLPAVAIPPSAAGAATTWLQRIRGELARLVPAFAPLHFLRTCWQMRPLTALAVSLSVSLPWYLLVSWKTDGEWLREFLLEHNWGRAASAMEGHRGSFLYYPVALLVGTFPWSIFALPTWIESARCIRRRDSWSAGTAFATCWIGVYVGLFTIARTKLPSYITPCYPALALLTGCFVERWVTHRESTAEFWPRVSFAVLALVGVGLLLGLPIAASFYLPGEQWLALIGLIPLLGAGLAFGLTQRNRRMSAAVTMTATASVFMVALFGFAAVRIDRWRETDQLLAAIRANGSHPEVGAWGRLEPSWVFYVGHPIVELASGAPTPAAAALGGSQWKPKPRPSVADFLHEAPHRLVITTASHAKSLGPLPDDVLVLAEFPYFLRNERLVILGSPQPATADRHDGDDSRRRR